MNARYFAFLLIGPMLTVAPTAAFAQDNGSSENSASAPVYCKSGGPSIFTGRSSNAKNCVAPPAQPRCKAQHPSIFSGRRPTGTCTVVSVADQTPVQRASIFSGGARRKKTDDVPSYAAAYPSQAPEQPVVLADGTVVQQPAPSTNASVATPPKPKRRRASIFTGGARRKD